MKHSLLAVLLVACATAVSSGEDSVQEKIDDALLPMPSALRDGAEVFSYDSGWNRTVLRAGTNSIRCVAPGSATFSPNFVAQCFHESWESPFLRISQLQAEGMALDEVFKVLLEEIGEGKVAGPDAGSVVYEILTTVVGASVAAHPNMAVSTPGGTAASTGFSTKPDAYRPWLMLAGTPMAHVMIPGK